MTPAEFRRLAGQKESAAAALVADAGRLRAQAAELAGILDPLIPMSQRAWIGPAADDFVDQVRKHSRGLEGEVQRIRSIADDLVRRSDRLRVEAVELRAKATVAEQVAMAQSGAL